MSQQFLHIETPLIESISLSNYLQKPVYLKMDNMQVPGSFKIRGIGRLCQLSAEKGAKHFVSSSGGNAGIAVAYAGKMLNIPVTVFIPKTSNEIFLKALKEYGAIINIEGNVWDESHTAAMAYTNEIGATYIPPFDHPVLWDGHATLIDEVANTGIEPDGVIAAVGGGGLACGILQGMQNNKWNNTRLITAETIGAAAFAKSLEAGELVTLDKITSIATSLGARQVAARLFEWSNERQITPAIVSDEQAMDACKKMLDTHRVLVEPSAGAALSLVFNRHKALSDCKSILVVVCGGIGNSLEIM
tara:strand:+ start:5582 stop:6490 length:909 start_codon:yes stop_codon:yes gene_type:complete